MSNWKLDVALPKLRGGVLDMVFVHYDTDTWQHYRSVCFAGARPWMVSEAVRRRVETLIASCSICGAILRGERDTARTLMLSLLDPLDLTRCIAFCCFGVVGAEVCPAWRRMCAYVECSGGMPRARCTCGGSRCVSVRAFVCVCVWVQPFLTGAGCGGAWWPRAPVAPSRWFASRPGVRGAGGVSVCGVGFVSSFCGSGCA